MKKYLIIAGVVLVVLLGGWVIILMTRKKFTPIEALTKDTTIDENQAKNIADGLEFAMSGAGTNEKKVFDLLTGLKPNDLVLVYNAFGLRKFAFWQAPTNLITWFQNDYSGDELDTIKLLWSSAGFII